MKIRYCVICEAAMEVPKQSGRKYCDSCLPERNRQKADDHYARVVESGKVVEYRKRSAANPNKRNQYLLKTYGITEEQYTELLEKQNGCCAVCLKPQEKQPNRRFAVDHLHVPPYTVRGILCDWCNRRVIGSHKDPALLRRAADYLENDTGFYAPGNVRKKRRKKRRNFNDS